METSLGWQIVSAQYSTHIVRNEDEALRYAHTLRDAPVTIRVIYAAREEWATTRSFAA